MFADVIEAFRRDVDKAINNHTIGLRQIGTHELERAQGRLDGLDEAKSIMRETMRRYEYDDD